MGTVVKYIPPKKTVYKDRHEDRVSEMRKELERFVRCFHLGREVSQASPQAPS